METLSEDRESAPAHPDIEVIQAKVKQESAFVDRLTEEVGRVIVGQKYMVERLLIGLLADGHVDGDNIHSWCAKPTSSTGVILDGLRDDRLGRTRSERRLRYRCTV